MTDPAVPVDRILATSVYIDGANRPFGELTVEQVRARAAELRASVGWGPTARVAPVARAWQELARGLEQSGAVTVAELDPVWVTDMAPKLWIVSPVF
jgi:hypothetical protein